MKPRCRRLASFVLGVTLVTSCQPAGMAQEMHVLAASPAPQTTRYEVRSGDSLFSIAERHNTKIEHIIEQNPHIDPEHLAVGQVLQVPTNTVVRQKTRAEQEESAARMVLTQSGEPSRYMKMIPCKLTAYSNSFESCGKRPGDPGYGITASGRPAKEGYTIAVDPKIIPLHSIVYIPGIGVRYAEDTGGAVKGAHIDVFFDNDGFCQQFGVQQRNVYILEEGARES